MNFEERLSAAFRNSDITMPVGRLDYGETIARGKRIRWRRFALVGATVTAVVAGGLVVGNVVTSGGSDQMVPAGPEPTRTDATDDPTPTCEPGTKLGGSDAEKYCVELVRPNSAASQVASFQPGQTSDECSGGMDAHPGSEQEGLPAAVNEVRRDIITRTWTCDYESLEEIALHGKRRFEYTRDIVGVKPALFWKNLEESGEPVGAVTRYLARTLETSPAEVMTKSWGRVYVWPAAAVAETPSGQQFDELEKVYEELQVDEMRRNGKFHGYRVEITEDGDWISFVYQSS